MQKTSLNLISISLLSCEHLSMNDNNNLKSTYPMTKKVNTSDLYFSKKFKIHIDGLRMIWIKRQRVG
jgi:hypothetical protein